MLRWWLRWMSCHPRRLDAFCFPSNQPTLPSWSISKYCFSSSSGKSPVNRGTGQNLISDITSDRLAEKGTPNSTIQYVQTPDPSNPWEHPFQLVEREDSYALGLTRVTDIQREQERDDQVDETISLENVELPRVVDEQGRSYGIGARKTSTSEVWLKAGTGNYFVNGKPMIRHFREIRLIEEALEPLLHFNIAHQFDADCFVVGGGESGIVQVPNFSYG
jgi:hypothetical protein